MNTATMNPTVSAVDADPGGDNRAQRRAAVRRRAARAAAPGDAEGLPGAHGHGRYLFLMPEEAGFVAAVVARFLPDDGAAADPSRPSAGPDVIPRFLDRLLARSADGGADAGSLAARFRAAVAALNLHTHAVYGGRAFAALAPDEQDAVLAALETGAIATDGLAPAAFFDFLLEQSLRGYLSDPQDEDGREGEVWRLIGFLSSFSTLTLSD